MTKTHICAKVYLLVAIDMARRRITVSKRKLRELILYIADKCADDPAFGATKLNKILFYADFLSYLDHGEPITGATYQRLGNGPAPRELLPVRSEMEERGDLIRIQRRRFGYQQDRPISTRPPDLDPFTAQEIAIVDDVIRALWGLSAAQVSELSHQDLGWKLARDQEKIPYETALIGSIEPVP